MNVGLSNTLNEGSSQDRRVIGPVQNALQTLCRAGEQWGRDGDNRKRINLGGGGCGLWALGLSSWSEEGLKGPRTASHWGS